MVRGRSGGLDRLERRRLARRVARCGATPGHVRRVAAHQRSVSAPGVRRGSDSRRRGRHHPGQQDRPVGGRRGAVPRHSHRGGRAALPRSRRHHRRAPIPADTQGRPGHRRLSGRRLDPGDRPQARGGRRRDHRADRRPLAAGRLGARARRRRRVPGGAPAGGRMALAHHAGGSTCGASPLRAGRSPAGGTGSGSRVYQPSQGG